MDCDRVVVGLVMALALVGRANAAEPSRGADLPWHTYEAEQSSTNGTILGPEYTAHAPAREASGRKCVRLAATGDFLEFKATADAQGMVVRYCLPDSADGKGIDATLSLYVNGSLRDQLPMTSRYCYLYVTYPYTNVPSDGTPRHFWDELRLMPGPIHSGDVIRLQKDADDASPEYLIDFVDLESVPPPLPRPVNSLSVTEFGAAADGQADARPAFLAAIAAGKQSHAVVWIPPGYYSMSGPIEVNNISIRGAGMWYSTLVGMGDYSSARRVAVYGNGSNVELADFAILGKLNYRNDLEPNDGLGGTFGTGSSIRNIWVEHTKTGAWIVNSDGLLVEGCRFRDTIADGINLCVGMRNTTVRNCSARGTGDDCFAMWPATFQQSIYTPGHNRFEHCTAQLPFLAQGFSIYGGEDNTVDDCLAVDIPYGAGLFASSTFPTEFGFRGITAYRHVQLVRTGYDDGAIGVIANRIGVGGLRFQDVDISDSPRDGVKFTSLNGNAASEAAFDQLRIVNPGLSGQGCGITEAPGAAGSATISHMTIVHPKTAGFKSTSSAFNLIVGVGNSGLEETELPGADDSAARRASAGQ